MFDDGSKREAVGKYASVIYNQSTKQYEKFELFEHFQRVRNMKNMLSSLLKFRQNLLNHFASVTKRDTKSRKDKSKANQIVVDSSMFVKQLCLEYGDEASIQKVLDHFKQALNDYNLSSNLDFFSYSKEKYNNELESNSISELNEYLKEFFISHGLKLDSLALLLNILNQAKVSVECLKKNQNFFEALYRVIQRESLPQFTLNECTPIYHDQNDPIQIQVDPIELLIHQFLESKEKNIRLLCILVKSFLNMIHSEEEKEKLCLKKSLKFIQLLTSNVLDIKVDFEEGEKFNEMRQDLNETHVKAHSSSDLYYKLLGSLELAVLVRQSQFKQFRNLSNKIEKLFIRKQNETELQVRILNLLKKSPFNKRNIYAVFTKLSCVLPEAENRHVREFVDSFYLNNESKSIIIDLLIAMHKFLNQEQELAAILKNKTQFFDKFNLFVQYQKLLLKSDLDELNEKKD